MSIDWQAWIGLPHEVGADPRNGKGACCLMICNLVLVDAGYKFPDIKELLELAVKENWIALQRKFDECCYVIDFPEINSLTLIRNGTAGLGLGVVVDSNKLLFPHHKRGVIAAPIDQLRLMQYRKLFQ